VVTWLVLIVLSAATGVVVAQLMHGWVGVVSAAAVPFLGTLAWILYGVYFVPYTGGGASMWPIALFFTGWAAALAGLGGYAMGRRLRREQA
jgi:hypothetical protein